MRASSGLKLLSMTRPKAGPELLRSAAEFLNPAGFVQGGFVGAMLDIRWVRRHFVTEGRYFTTTISMNVQFLTPARAGKFTGEGQVVLFGKTIAFMEAKLRDAQAVWSRQLRQAPGS